MKKARKVIAMVLVLALTVAMSVAGTIAYLTDTDNKTNVFTVGNVAIELIEKQRVLDDKTGLREDPTDFETLEDFEQGKQLDPIVVPKDGTKYDSDNYVDKIVTIKNTGSNEAYVRLILAIPVVKDFDERTSQSENWLHWNVFSHTDTKDDQGNGTNGWFWGTEETGEYPEDVNEWNSIKGTNGKPEVFSIDGKDYMIYIATNVLPIASGATTEPSLRGLFLDSRVDCKVDANGGKTHFITIGGTEYELGDLSNLEIKVFAQAVQTAGFESAWDAFEVAAMPANPWA